MSVLEAAVGFAIAGSVVAVAIPVFVREVHASRLVEAEASLAALGASAVAYAVRAREAGAPIAEALPPSAPLTPAEVPRGHARSGDVDPWSAWTPSPPGWAALGFTPTSRTAARAFAFALDTERGPGESAFVAHAHGDLDGDGVTSTFELRGRVSQAEGSRLDPGMYVASEVE